METELRPGFVSLLGPKVEGLGEEQAVACDLSGKDVPHVSRPCYGEPRPCYGEPRPCYGRPPER